MSGVGDKLSSLDTEGGVMADEQDLESKMVHLEDQVGALAEHVNSMTALVNSLLGDIGTLSDGLVRVRRSNAITQMQLNATVIRNYLFSMEGQAELATNAKLCREFLERRYALLIGQVPRSDDPEQLLDTLLSSVIEYCRRYNFDPFMPM